jgi:hypothetical protein
MILVLGRRENPIVLMPAAEAVCLERAPDRHKSSFDFDATLGLKLDISALQHAPSERRTSPWEPAP